MGPVCSETFFVKNHKLSITPQPQKLEKKEHRFGILIYNF
jgi:hypothetical protein